MICRGQGGTGIVVGMRKKFPVTLTDTQRDHLKQLLQLLARGRGSIDLPGGWAEIRDGDVVFSVGPRSRAR